MVGSGSSSLRQPRIALKSPGKEREKARVAGLGRELLHTSCTRWVSPAKNQTQAPAAPGAFVPFVF